MVHGRPRAAIAGIRCVDNKKDLSEPMHLFSDVCKALRILEVIVYSRERMQRFIATLLPLTSAGEKFSRSNIPSVDGHIRAEVAS